MAMKHLDARTAMKETLSAVTQRGQVTVLQKCAGCWTSASAIRAVTEYKEFPDRSHFTIEAPGWEEVADYAIDWAAAPAASKSSV
jgi:hypothetical protein